jgi:formate C-acetyltransferase
LSALMDGCLDSGRDAGQGGARYNSSGVSIVGLSDVVDSLTAIRPLVFEQKQVGMEELLEALRSDFSHDAALHARIMHRVPKFGDGDPVPIEIARNIMEELDRMFGEMEHYRSGRYHVGLWSMSHHVAFGNLSGALPSGRRAYEPFTPGITPSAAAGAVLTDQINTVASLDAVNMPNNMAFNIKVVPHPKDSFSQTVDQMSAYTRAYVELGGMQMQYNVMDTETMRRAMEHPEQYRDLMVRISGYNAYFVELDPSIQLELINRAEHGLGQATGPIACDP